MSIEINSPPPAWPASLQQAWKAAVELANFVAAELDETKLPASDRMRAAGAAWWVSLEHHSSIILLVLNAKHASAYALLRPQIDAYLRGLWLSVSASEAELAGFLSGDRSPGGDKLARRLEAEGCFDPDSLTAIQKQIWATVCDYTHTGSRQITRHLTDSSIEPAHDPDELIELLSVAGAWALMSAIGVASAAQDHEKCERSLAEACRIADTSESKSRHSFT
jgi:hypothetical protein